MKVCGFPHWATKEKAVEEVALFGWRNCGGGQVFSIPGVGPIRLKVSCKDPKAMKGYIDLLCILTGKRFQDLLRLLAIS